MAKITRTTISVPTDLFEKFKIYSESQHRSVSAQISALIEDALNKASEKK